MKKFLVVIDTQYDFVMPNGALYVNGAEAIVIPGIEFLANLNPEEYEGVLFTFDSHTPEVYLGSPESELFPIHCERGTPGWNNVFNPSLIDPVIAVYALCKGVFDMWEEPSMPFTIPRKPLDQNLLFTTNKDRDSFFQDLLERKVPIEAFGVASDYCLKQGVDGLVKRGFHVTVREDLSRGINQTTQEVFDLYPTVTVV